jgi:hypothetical protein
MTTAPIHQISPAQGGQYSPNLYRWLTREQKRMTDSQVFREKGDGTLWIGRVDHGFFTGSRLIRAMCSPLPRPGAYFGLQKRLTLIKDFWPRYAKIGRCAIDTEHRMYFDGEAALTRYETHGDDRICLWCGHQQTRLTWIVPVEHSQWA